MSVDQYASCPCGSGKKLKFCCSDLIGDLEKIHRMIEGDQTHAALRRVEQALAEHPDRASLLDLKLSLEMSLEDLDATQQTLKTFVEAHPDNPSAHAGQAFLLSCTTGGRAAVDSMQRALSLLTGGVVPQRVYDALLAVGRGLLNEGRVVAAQAHLWFCTAIAPEGDSRALKLILALNRHEGLPLLLRDNPNLRLPPEGAAWSGEMDRVLELSATGKWKEAVHEIDQLGAKYGATPSLVYNRAMLGGYLGDNRALVAGLHAYAQLDVPLDDAVEAEAMAQLLDEECREEPIDSVALTYTIQDQESLIALLDAEPRFVRYEIGAPTEDGSDSLPPSHRYLLLDRSPPPKGEEITSSEVPRQIGLVSLFPRQTDRAEHLVLSTDRDSQLEATQAMLVELAKEMLGAKTDEQVIGQTSITELVLNRRWHLPPETSPSQGRKLIAEGNQKVFLKQWPELARPELAGKTPREAASLPALRIPLMALVLVLELGTHNQAQTETFATMRHDLGLPQPEPIESLPEQERFPVSRVHRLAVENLSDDALVLLYRRSVIASAGAAIHLLAREAIARPAVYEAIPPATAYRQLIALEEEPSKVLDWIDKARRLSEETGEATVEWDLAELELHISEGAADEAKAMLVQIEEKHRNTPGVMTAVYQLLHEMGLIPPEIMAGIASASADPIRGGQAAPALAMSGSPSEEPESRIWTPDSDRPEGEKSALWTP